MQQATTETTHPYQHVLDEALKNLPQEWLVLRSEDYAEGTIAVAVQPPPGGLHDVPSITVFVDAEGMLCLDSSWEPFVNVERDVVDLEKALWDILQRNLNDYGRWSIGLQASGCGYRAEFELSPWANYVLCDLQDFDRHLGAHYVLRDVDGLVSRPPAVGDLLWVASVHEEVLLSVVEVSQDRFENDSIEVECVKAHTRMWPR